MQKVAKIAAHQLPELLELSLQEVLTDQMGHPVGLQDVYLFLVHLPVSMYDLPCELHSAAPEVPRIFPAPCFCSHLLLLRIITPPHFPVLLKKYVLGCVNITK